MLYRVHLARAGFELTMLVVIATDIIFYLAYEHGLGEVIGDFYPFQ
jgi:hypothetical protein